VPVEPGKAGPGRIHEDRIAAVSQKPRPTGRVPERRLWDRFQASLRRCSALELTVLRGPRLLELGGCIVTKFHGFAQAPVFSAFGRLDESILTPKSKIV
jgi:hypothetical protein